MAPIKTAVLGVGLAGLTFHVPFILALDDLFSLHAVLERNPTSEGGKLKDRFGITTAKVYRSLDGVLADSDIELVIVGTPNDTHYGFAKAALQAGKHVLVDKPVTATVEQARELYEIAQEKKLVLYAFQNRRWDADFLALQHLLSTDTLGAITDFESRFDRFRPTLKGTWKDEPLPAAGQTFDLGSHLIDQALTLFGRPNKITSFLQNTRGLGNAEVDDTFTILMHYSASPNRSHPLTVTLRAHPLTVASRHVRYIVRGNQGTYKKYGVDVQEDQLKAISSPKDIFADSFGKEPRDMWGDLEVLGPEDAVVESKWPSDSPGSMVNLFKNLASAIQKGEETAVKWEQATAVIEMITLAQKSSKEGQTLDVPRN